MRNCIWVLCTKINMLLNNIYYFKVYPKLDNMQNYRKFINKIINKPKINIEFYKYMFAIAIIGSGLLLIFFSRKLVILCPYMN